jgi:hypothetical protein
LSDDGLQIRRTDAFRRWTGGDGYFPIQGVTVEEPVISLLVGQDERSSALFSMRMEPGFAERLLAALGLGRLEQLAGRRAIIRRGRFQGIELSEAEARRARILG